MAKTKQKTHSETEHLRGQVKRLKSINRQLRKRLKELQSKAHFYEEVVDEVADEVKMKEICASCGKGEISSIDFVHLVLKKCQLCGDQQRIPKHGQKTKTSKS